MTYAACTFTGFLIGTVFASLSFLKEACLHDAGHKCYHCGEQS